MTSRIHRGFHRIGVVLVVLALLLDAALIAGNVLNTIVPLIVLPVAVGWVLDGFMGSDRP